ncbi:MAG: hypothetical protein ACREA0_30650, partial [bacterium]
GDAIKQHGTAVRALQELAIKFHPLAIEFVLNFPYSHLGFLKTGADVTWGNPRQGTGLPFIE